jgi:putative membrane protein
MAVTPSDPSPQVEAEPPAAVESMLRLHPLSWLFVLLTQLRSLVVPLLVLVVLGRGEWWELFIVVGAIGYALYALIYSIGFRYRLGDDELLVKEGIFARTERHIPYGRIQNIVRRRNLLHRAFDVAELRLESAGGSKPEAVMNVITLAAAQRIEAVLRCSDAPDTAADARAPLLALDWRDLLRLGLVRNRGGVLVGAIFALAWQFEPWERSGIRAYLRKFADLFATDGGLLDNRLGWALSIFGLLLAFYLLIKLVSVAMALLTFHRFSLVSDGTRVATEGGLLTRHAASARVEKIQRLIYGESWLSRKFGRRWLACDVAAGGREAENGESAARLRWLAPIAAPERIDSLVAELMPGLELRTRVWHPLHPRAWLRTFKASALIWSAASLPLWLYLGVRALPLWLALMVWSVIESRGSARFAAYSCEHGVFAWRSGFLNREWVVARIHKGQGVALRTSPFDRRAGMASVELDTAGSTAIGSRLRVPYLDESQARSLMAQLRSGIDANGH